MTQRLTLTEDQVDLVVHALELLDQKYKEIGDVDSFMSNEANIDFLLNNTFIDPFKVKYTFLPFEIKLINRALRLHAHQLTFDVSEAVDLDSQKTAWNLLDLQQDTFNLLFKFKCYFCR